MFSTEHPSPPAAGFGAFLAKLGGLIALGLAVWAGLAAAVVIHGDYPVRTTALAPAPSAASAWNSLQRTILAHANPTHQDSGIAQ